MVPRERWIKQNRAIEITGHKTGGRRQDDDRAIKLLSTNKPYSVINAEIKHV